LGAIDLRETIGQLLPAIHKEKGYSTWEQLAGYFDGDGCPKVHVGIYVITVTVTWSDQYRDMLHRINQFLSQKGVVGKIGLFKRGQSVYYELHVSEGRNALFVLKRMLPHLDKKRSQVKAAVDYLENRITGNQFIEALNEAVRANKRSSSIKVASLPHTKRQGKHISKSRGGHRSRVMTENQILDAKVKRSVRGLTFRELAKVHHVAPSTIYRLLTSIREP
jgi:hypothetical protein